MAFLKLRNGNYVFLTHEKQKNIDSFIFEENKDYPLISFSHHTSKLQNKLRTEYLNDIYSESINKISEREDYWSVIELEGEEAQENVTDLIIDYCAEYPNMRVDKVKINESIFETIYRNMATFDDYYYPLGKLIRLTTVHIDLKGDTFFDFLKRKKNMSLQWIYLLTILKK
ncbi:hypothetical protein [Psychrobacillus sp. L4]|uniref:hypothetical protein n=1 Tax=Psychrobacillus sp. L4 TaxID=3236892 RepID=UPI0036F39FD2